MVMLALGALALLFYFIGWLIPAAIAVAVGVAVLVWSVLTHR
jgi:hypothetical protein